MPQPVDGLQRWRIAGVVASVVIVLAIPLYVVKERLIAWEDPVAVTAASFVGRDNCISCHEDAYQKWRGSDHDHSMAVASQETVLGDFEDRVFEHQGISSRFYRKDGKYFVRTQGPAGEMNDFEVAYTFGIEPLQQYLIRFPGGRLQALTIAWDVERRRWFFLYPAQEIPPDDWLHWTRAAQNWNGMCADCHSTNLIKGYDPVSKTFDTTWSEIDVSCEACHGPGSRHVEWAELPPMARPPVDNYELVVRTSGIGSRQQVEQCAPCHSRRSELGEYDYTSTDLMDNVVPRILDEGMYYADGQILEEVYVYGSFVQSKMFANDVGCSDCHDVHSLELVKEGNGLCLQCHRGDAYDSYNHHFHQKTYEGKPNDGALCVKCHMPERPYMVVDFRADHSLRVPRPDLTLQTGTPNACSQSGCHGDQPVAWSVTHFEKWYGLAKKPHYGTTLAAGRQGKPEAKAELIRLTTDTLHPAIVRATALSLLGSYPSAESTAALQRALADEEALVRYMAVDQADSGALSPQQVTDFVTPLLFDPVRAVHTLAATKLAGIPEKRLKPYQQEALEKSLADYEKTMTYSLDFPFAGFNLGNLYARLGEPEKAEAYYQTAIEIDDRFVPAKANLALLYNSRGRNEQAEALYRQILVSYPDMHETAYSLGLLLGEMNRYSEAAEFLKEAADGMPKRSRVHYNLGLVLQYLGRNREAEAALILALDIEPDNLDYLFALAQHYLKRGELSKTLQIAERMISRHPDNPVGQDLKEHVQRVLKSIPGQ